MDIFYILCIYNPPEGGFRDISGEKRLAFLKVLWGMGCSHLEYEMDVYQQPPDTFPHQALSFKVIDYLCH